MRPEKCLAPASNGDNRMKTLLVISSDCHQCYEPGVLISLIAPLLRTRSFDPARRSLLAKRISHCCCCRWSLLSL